jgi:P27 family predicted phage terminase small subunit
MRKSVKNVNLTALDLKPEHINEAVRLRPETRLENDELIVWDRIAPLLALHGYLNDLFVDSLVEYCRVIITIDRLAKFLRHEGDTYNTSTRNGLQIKSRPEIGQLNESRRMLRSYVGDFGLTPQARKQLESAQMDMFGDDENNPFLQIERAYATHNVSH